MFRSAENGHIPETLRPYGLPMPRRRRSVLPARLTIRPDGGPQEDVLAELRRVIVAGGVPPGNPVPVGEVANVLGVSPIRVREALRQLIGEGLVEHKPNLGFTIAQLTPNELSEIYLVRELLENAALAAAIGSAGDLDDQAAAAACDELDRAIRDDDSAGYHRFSRAFHLALVRPSKMGRLLHMLELAWNVTEPVQPMAYVPVADRLSLHHEHIQMLEAFTTRNTRLLLAVSKRHYERLKVAIGKLPPETGLLSDV